MTSILFNNGSSGTLNMAQSNNYKTPPVLTDNNGLWKMENGNQNLDNV